MAEYVYYATPNLAATSLLPAEFLENPVIYPDSSVLERSEFYQELPARAVKKRNTIFARVIR
jgi:spermidine/putrescine transport system substrate-binding protein